MYFPRFTSCTVTDTFIRAFRSTRYTCNHEQTDRSIPLDRVTDARSLPCVAGCRRLSPLLHTEDDDDDERLPKGTKKKKKKRKRKEKRRSSCLLLPHVRVTHTRSFLPFFLSLFFFSLSFSFDGQKSWTLRKEKRNKKQKRKGKTKKEGKHKRERKRV